MFGADDPLLALGERLLADWKSDGYGDNALDRVLRRNGEASLATLNG